jgi:hypothetical protein
MWADCAALLLLCLSPRSDKPSPAALQASAAEAKAALEKCEESLRLTRAEFKDRETELTQTIKRGIWE